jgi:hypothetical protein
MQSPMLGSHDSHESPSPLPLDWVEDDDVQALEGDGDVAQRESMGATCPVAPVAALRLCTKCARLLPDTDDVFYPHTRRSNGHRCRQCANRSVAAHVIP